MLKMIATSIIIGYCMQQSLGLSGCQCCMQTFDRTMTNSYYDQQKPGLKSETLPANLFQIVTSVK